MRCETGWVSPRHAGLLGALAAIWGGSYLLIKYALEDLSAPMVVWGRVVIAAVVLLVALRLTGGSAAVRGAGATLRERPRTALLLGVLAVALPFMLITLGELEVPSGLTAVLISPASLFVALFAPFIDPSGADQPPRRRSGMLMGLGGVALVVGVESVQSVGRVPRRAGDDRRGRVLRAVELRGQGPLRAHGGDADVARSRSR